MRSVKPATSRFVFRASVFAHLLRRLGQRFARPPHCWYAQALYGRASVG